MTAKGTDLYIGRSENAVMPPVQQRVDSSHDWTFNHDAAPESVAESLWVLPCHSVASADWTRVFWSVSDNSGARALSFIHDEPITEPYAIIGWKQGRGQRFILCSLRHCTPLEGGSYRVGLLVDELIRLEPEHVETMRQVFEERSANRCP
jgi:hypothetical protein